MTPCQESPSFPSSNLGAQSLAVATTERVSSCRSFGGILGLIALVALIGIAPTTQAQTNLFSETFNETNGSISGLSAEGISWSSTGSINGQSTSSVQTGQFQSTKSNTVWTSDPFDVSLYTSLNISATLTSSDVDANDNLKVEVYVDDTPTQVYYGTSAATSIVEVSIPDGSQAYIEITANTDAKFDTYKWDNVTLSGTLNCTDTDGDGICDDGTDLCTNTSACNYDGSLYANAACLIPGTCDSCDGGAVTDGDSDNDGICNASDLCSNLAACNYDGALYTNASCNIPTGCDSCSGGAVVDGSGDSDSDGICDGNDNCSDTGACNYNDISNVSCVFQTPCSCTASWDVVSTSLTGISQTSYSPVETFTFDANTLANVTTVDVTMTAVGGTTNNWASDLLMAIVDPNGNSIEWGGFSNPTFGQGFTGNASTWPTSPVNWGSGGSCGIPLDCYH